MEKNKKKVIVVIVLVCIIIIGLVFLFLGANNIINYINAADGIGVKNADTFWLVDSDTKKVMSSTSSNPIKLELEKYKLTAGSQGYNCSSLITKISIVD